jgi:hypothetical protein
MWPERSVVMRALYLYEPFVLRRAAEGRIFFVSSKMPFEFFVQCFQAEQPFFFISQLDDGRIAIIPNTMFIPWNVMQGGLGPTELFPSEIEYVTAKDGTYPLIITAHPVSNFEDWFRKFERCVVPFAKQTLSDFVGSSCGFQPLEFEPKTRTKGRTQFAETAAR